MRCSWTVRAARRLSLLEAALLLSCVGGLALGCDSGPVNDPDVQRDPDAGNHEPDAGKGPLVRDGSVRDAAMVDAASDASSLDADLSNQPPRALGDRFSMSEDGPAAAGNVPMATDSDGTVDPNGYALVDDVDIGVLVFNPDGSYVFDPAFALDVLPPSGMRVVSFTYTARDDDGALSAPARVSITVLGANDVPELALGIADQQATQDEVWSFVLPLGTFTDRDEGDTLTWSAPGLPTWLSFDAATRTLQGTPQSAQVGATTVTIVVMDEAGASAQDSFALTVLGASTGSVVEQYTYDAAGRLTQVAYGEARVVRYVYDPAGNVLQQEVVTP